MDNNRLEWAENLIDSSPEEFFIWLDNFEVRSPEAADAFTDSEEVLTRLATKIVSLSPADLLRFRRFLRSEWQELDEKVQELLDAPATQVNAPAPQVQELMDAPAPAGLPPPVLPRTQIALIEEQLLRADFDDGVYQAVIDLQNQQPTLYDIAGHLGITMAQTYINALREALQRLVRARRIADINGHYLSRQQIVDMNAPARFDLNDAQLFETVVRVQRSPEGPTFRRILEALRISPFSGAMRTVRDALQRLVEAGRIVIVAGPNMLTHQYQLVGPARLPQQEIPQQAFPPPLSDTELATKRLSRLPDMAFDMLMYMEEEMQTVLEDEDNMVFVVSQHAFFYPREQMEKQIQDKEFFYECYSQRPAIDNVNTGNPFVKIDSPQGAYYVPANQLAAALVLQGNVFYITKQQREIERSIKIDHLAVATGRNFRGQHVNFVSADHCQDGTNKTIYALKQVVLNQAGGRKHRRHRSTRKRHSRRSTRKHRRHRATRRKRSRRSTRKRSRRSTRKHRRQSRRKRR
jgi:nitroreductase